MTTKKRALDVQEGGNHYKKMPIQPVEYCYHNKLGVCESNIIKYVTRWRDKNGIQDLEKARHYIDLLIEFARDEQVKESDWPADDRIEAIGQNGNDGAIYDKQYRDLEKPWEWEVGDIAEATSDGEVVTSTIFSIDDGIDGNLVFQLAGIKKWFHPESFNNVTYKP